MAKIKGKHCTEDKPISIKNVCGSRIWQYQVKTKQAESQDEEIMPLGVFSRYSDNCALNETFLTSDLHSL